MFYKLYALLRRRRHYRYARRLPGALRQRLVYGVGVLFVIFALHTLAMVVFEAMSLSDAIWLTLTTATTVGYGDASAVTAAGRTATVLLIYLIGIFLLAQVAADVFDYRSLLRDRKRCGTYRWRRMDNHLLIINSPQEYAETYLPRLVDQIRHTPGMHDIPIHVLTSEFPDGLPIELVNLGVTHNTGIGESTENLRATHADKAKYIFVIAAAASQVRQDALTYDVLARLAQIGTEATIIAEVVEDTNRARTLALGATTVIRPVRAYPELAVRAMVEPGTEQVLETLFTYQDDRLAVFNVPFDNVRWQDLVINSVQHGSGIPIGYLQAGRVTTNPPPTSVVSGTGLVMLLDESLQVSADQVRNSVLAST